MKKVTFMLLAALMAVMSYAQAPKGQKAPQPVNRYSTENVGTLPNQLSMPAMLANKARAPRKAELVTPPSGDVVYYTLEGMNSRGGGVTTTRTVKAIFNGSDVYVTGLGWYCPDAWVKGTIEGETATFAMGQYLGNPGVDLYFAGSDGNDLTDATASYDAETGNFEFETFIMDNQDVSQGIGFYAYWSTGLTLTKIEGEVDMPVEAPEALVTEQYTFQGVSVSYDNNDEAVYTAASFPVQVGFDGNDCYIQGLCSYLPEAWVKGTKNNDGTYTFTTGQLYGTYNNRYEMWFVGLEGEELADVIFTYDAEVGKFATEQGIALNGYKNELYWYNQYLEVTITKVVETAAMPADPEVTGIEDSEYGKIVTFNVPVVDSEGNGLLTSKLTYMFYTDVEGEIAPLTFTPTTHVKLTEELTEIPYGFTESYDFYDTYIYLNDLYSKSWNKIGIQSIYYGGGETNATEIQWYDIKPYATPSIVWVAAEQGYEHQQNIEEIDFGEGVTATLLQNSASTAPRYWSKDQTLRTYAGNTITITSAEQTINKIEFTFPLNASDVALEADKGDYERTGNVGTWTGEENEVTFTSGKAFISQIAIYLGNGEVKLVELPEGVVTEVWTIEGTYSDGESNDNITRPTEAAIVGNTIYVKGIPFWFEDAWMKGTIDAESSIATFKTGQFVGEDSYGQEFMIGSDDGQTICDIEFLYDAEEKTLTQLTSYIVENADTPDEIAPYGWWYDMVIYAGEPVIVEPVEAPEGLETSSYLFTAHALENGYDGFEDYSAQLQVGFDGQDVYFQGIATDVPDLWVKGTLSEDGKTVTIPANQYMGQLYVWGYSFDYFFTAVDPETYELTDVVLNYDAETNTFSTDQLLALNGNKRSLDYYLLYTNVNITKLIEVAATPADPEILDFVGTGSYPKVKFDIPAVDIEGNPLITAKLFYTIWVEKNGQEEKLTITAEEYRNVTEDMVEIPYNYDDSWDIYAGGEIFYLNQSMEEIQSWTKIGVQSIYTAAGETNKSNVVWMDLTQYWETTGIAEVKNDGKKAVIFNMQGQKLNSVPAKGLYIMNNRKYVVK